MIKRIADGRTDLVWDLLAAGHPATTTDTGGTPVIRWCAYYGDISAIRYLLSQGEQLESLGQNLDLSGAVFHGHWELCQYLLEQGADARYADPETGETPLHLALSKANRPRHEHCVRLLLSAGADPNATTIPGAESGAFMRDSRTRGETPLHRAAAYGSPEIIELLLATGANRESVDANGDTPLSWASFHLRPDALLRLLCFGPHRIHPDRNSTYDHGQGWGVMGQGRPHMD